MAFTLKWEENMKSFTFNKENPIILYGAAAIGNIIYNNLHSQGYNIKGFIDKRASELTDYLGLPVWNINNNSLNTQNIIIIAVKNVFEHEQIVSQLLQNGYTNIIFKALNVLNGEGTNEEILLSEVYDKILENKPVKDTILSSTVNANIYTFKDYGSSSIDDENVIARIPLEFVYTNNYTSVESKWGNINILSFFTHIHFFKFLLGDYTKVPDYYINEYCIYTAPPRIKITEGWKDNVIRNRLMILEQMNAANELEPDFFIRNAPTAVWNPKGYFNLTSGKHRAAFFAASNYKYIPLKLSKRDYEQYMAKQYAEILINYIKENSSSALTLPINNPLFYRYPMLTNEYYHSLLVYYTDYIAISSYFPQKILLWKNITIVEMSNDSYGIIGHFARMGCNAYKIVTETNNRELFDITQKVLHIPPVTLLSSHSIKQLKPDYFFIECDDPQNISDYANVIIPRNLIVICKTTVHPVIPGYCFKSKGITAYKQDHYVHTLNYKIKE